MHFTVLKENEPRKIVESHIRLSGIERLFFYPEVNI